MSARTGSASAASGPMNQQEDKSARLSLITQAFATNPDRHDILASLLNSVRQGVLVIDCKANLHYANQAAYRLLDLDHGVLTAFPDCDLILILGTWQTESTPLILELRLPAHDPHEDRIYRVELAPLPVDPDLFQILIDDITENLLSEQIRKDFVTNASHELRTPLSLISGYIETLQSGLIKGSASLHRCLEVMEKHSKRMMRIIEDMLTISRLESGDAQLRCDSFLVRGCVEDVLEHLTPLIELRHPVVTLDFPNNGGLLNGDRFYWDQVFTNLIENALKENPRTGLKLHISGRWTASECVLTVEDDGVGIPADDVPFVFKRFFRCAKHHSQETKGTGLGLSIVKRAVEAHGGSVRLESKANQRTAFIMTVPL
ncbi:MAG: sensor histidine kinase [Verrucomicrobiaceae bacterium]